MKKLLLSFVALATTVASVAQVAFTINPPSTNVGSYSVTYADDFSTWGVPDLAIPANAVVDTVAIVQGLDSLGCDPLTNGSDIAGKIAMVWRGDCQFGTKALNAQNEGAVAVVIVNNVGEPVGMAGGNDGLSVTIPVVMISTTTGQLIYDEIMAGNDVEVFIGNKLGFFGNDMGINQKDVLRPRYSALPIALAQDDNEFSVPLGGWIFNYGANTQTGITLNATVTVGGTVVHNETSTPIASMVSGDSAWVPLPTFSQTAYTQDLYEIVYTIETDSTDEFIDDNFLNADFTLTEDEITYARVDAATGEPVAEQFFQPGTFTSTFGNCVHFSNPNASRKAVTGLTFAATSRVDTQLDGEFVSLEAYEWTDVSTDFNDPAFDISQLTLVESGEFVFTTDSQQVNIYAPFDNTLDLQDDMAYIFCVTSGSQDVFLGFDNRVDYDENIRGADATGTVHGDGYLTTMVQSDGTYTPLGFGTDLQSGVMIHTTTLSSVDEEAVKLERPAFPNPAVHTITVPLSGVSGTGTMQIVDLTGKVMMVEQINAGQNQLTVDVSDMAAGMYVFNLQLENGKSSTFNVVVTK